ncbi:MAG: PAS domain S-box protein [Chloroflexi bacterium]|nr:PAS domain S-box protein [Chloroflexota bacterium]
MTLEQFAAPREIAAAEATELALLRDFFENASTGMHWVLKANRADYEFLGYSEDEYVGHHIAEFHVDPPVIADILARLSRGETLCDYPARLRTRDGGIRYVRIDSSARVQDGVVQHTRCLTRDVTGQIQDAEAARAADRRYRALVRALPALIVSTTPDGEIEEISESYAEYTGLTLEQAKDWQSHQVIHPDDYEQAMRVWGAALAGGDRMQNQMRLRRHDGVYRWYLVQGTPIRDDEGVIARWVTVNVDVEDRKRSEDRERFLAATTARLLGPADSDTLLSEMADLAVPTLADICTIGLFDGGPETPRAALAGADERERIPIGAVHLRRWLSAPGSTRTIGDCIMSGEAVVVDDLSEAWIRQCAPDEDQRRSALAVGATSVVCQPLMSRSRAIGMATLAMTRSRRRYTDDDVALIREICARVSIAVDNARLFRDLHETANRLELANAAKDEFLGMVSHELKTPITTIFGNAQILHARGAEIDEEARQDALADIRHESERLHRIVDNLLVLARLEGGKSPDMEPVLLQRTIEKVVASHGARFPHREFRYASLPRFRPVLAEPLYVEQVLRNLISNAEKYSPPGAPIEIGLYERGDHALAHPGRPSRSACTSVGTTPTSSCRTAVLALRAPTRTVCSHRSTAPPAPPATPTASGLASRSASA